MINIRTVNVKSVFPQITDLVCVGKKSNNFLICLRYLHAINESTPFYSHTKFKPKWIINMMPIPQKMPIGNFRSSKIEGMNEFMPSIKFII